MDLCGSSTTPDTQSCSPFPTSFPRFGDLPAELRLKIWKFALVQEGRVVVLHMYGDYGRWSRLLSHEEQRMWEEIDDNDDDALVDVTEIGDGYGHDHQTLRIMACTTGHCNCCGYYGGSSHTAPPPVLFWVCRESRGVLREAKKDYSMYFFKEYGPHGRPVIVPPENTGNEDSDRDEDNNDGETAQNEAAAVRRRWGVFMNPAVDTIAFKYDLGSTSSLHSLHQFARVAAYEAPKVRKVLLYTFIFMPPYRWFKRDSYDLWRRWGADGTWVPQTLPAFRYLTDVVLVVSESYWKKMLPQEWRARTLSIWHEELEKMRDRWPPEWEFRSPELRLELVDEMDVEY